VIVLPVAYVDGFVVVESTPIEDKQLFLEQNFIIIIIIIVWFL